MKRIIRVGTRESALALAQSKWVINEIKNKHPYLEFELVSIKTKGDIILDTRLDKIGGKGLFIKELEHALISKSIDIAVHSVKDMPAQIPEELVIAAVSKREDPRDVLVTARCETFEELRREAVIGTSSIRREIQVLGKRPDLRIQTLRGNVLTRLNKLLNNEYDGILLAAAGLKRLGLEERCVQYFDTGDIIPAVGQGALAVEARMDDDIGYLKDSVHCEEAAMAVSAERAFMIKLNGGCTTPMAAHAIVEGTRIKISGMLAWGDKLKVYNANIEGDSKDASKLGEKLAELIMEQI